MTFILLPHHCQGVQRVGIFPGRSLWKATENTKCLCIIHFHIVIKSFKVLNLVSNLSAPGKFLLVFLI